MPEQLPMRQRVKEWGEAADVWSKVGVRLGSLCAGLFAGDGLIHVLERLVGG